MKNTLMLALSLMMAAVLLPVELNAQQTGRRQGAAAIVGHWLDRDTHYFWGPLRQDETGTFGWEEGDGRVVRHRYKVISENRKTGEVTVQVLFASGGTRIEELTIAEGGKQIQRSFKVFGLKGSETLTFVDRRTTP